MLLVIPRLDIRDGVADYGALPAGSHMLADPVAMARVWRVQNAKTLLLCPLGAPASAKSVAVVLEVCRSLDIPVQVDCARVIDEDLSDLLQCGVYRIFLPHSIGPGKYAKLAERYGPRRLAVQIDTNVVGLKSRDKYASVVESFAALGCCRFVLSFADDSEASEVEAVVVALSALAPRARFTVTGCVSDFRSLEAIQSSPRCVDSVVIGEALYANRFPCQAVWCWHQLEDTDLERFSTARLADDGPSGRKSAPQQ